MDSVRLQFWQSQQMGNVMKVLTSKYGNTISLAVEGKSLVKRQRGSIVVSTIIDTEYFQYE